MIETKLFVVVLVLVIIFLSIIAYLIRIDIKLNKLEKEFKSKETKNG
jgi:hypothetical protein